MSKLILSGKRKTSVAKATINDGNGIVTINKRNYKSLNLFDRLKIEEPLKISEKVVGKINFDVVISVYGGGEKSQIDAARLALAKAIVAFTNSKELRKAFVEYDKSLLVADVRRKEANKPGDSKARSKRQTSYR